MTARYSGWTNSKSLNARAAEADGRYPATVMATMLRQLGLFPGVTAADINEAVGSGEWHHVGSYAAQVNYYSLFDVYSDRRALRAAIAARKAKPKPAATRHDGCTVTWLEWIGSRRHPRAEEYTAAGVAVTVKGQFLTIHLSPGADYRRSDTKARALIEIAAPRDVRKQLGGRGCKLRLADGRVL
jgi:hypothetical protein